MSDSKPNFTPALGFDFLTGLYDSAIAWTMPEAKIRDRLIELIHPQRGEKILEFGFGTGQNILRLGQMNSRAELYGLDIDPKVKDIAAGKLSAAGIGVELNLYTGKDFPFADGQFDTSFSCLVFHQLPRSAKKNALRELYRVTRPGGRLVIADWGPTPTALARLGFFAVQLLDGFENTEDNRQGIVPQYMEEAGFNQVIEVGSIETKIGTMWFYTGVK